MELGKETAGRLRARGIGETHGFRAMRRALAWLTVFVLAAVLTVPTGRAEAQADLNDFDRALIDLVNEWRAQQGLDILAVYDGLSDESLRWSTFMAGGSTDCASAGTRWGHSDLSLSDPSNPPGTSGIAENLAYACGTPGFPAARVWSRAAGPLPSYCTSPIDYTTPESTMCGWLSSTTHRPAIANPQNTHIGSGTATRSLSGGGGGIERWSTQLFTRSDVPRFDVSCDGSLDVIDALQIAQFDVGVRSGVSSCALTNTGAQLNVARADLNNDGNANVIDALIVARCVAGLQSC